MALWNSIKCSKPAMRFFFARNCSRSSEFLKKGLTMEEMKKYRSAKPFKEIPNVGDVPIFGTSWIYWPLIGKYTTDRQNEAHRDMKATLGDFFRQRAGGLDLFISTRAEDMETILVNSSKNPRRREYSPLKYYRESNEKRFKTTGLFTLQGPLWRVLRLKTQQHMLKPEAAERYLEPVLQVAEDLVKTIHTMTVSSNEVPDFLVQLNRWSLESMAYVGLNLRLGCLDPNTTAKSNCLRLIDCVLTQNECISKLDEYFGVFPFWQSINTPTWKRFVEACDLFHWIAFKFVAKAIENLPSRDVSDEEDLTFLELMLMKENLETSHVRVHLADMMKAGIETISNASAFLLYLLAKNQDKQEKIYEEIKRVLPENSKISKNALRELKYLRACLKESLRIVPIVGGNSRMLMRDTVFGGYQVPAGTLASVSFQAVNVNEKYYDEPQSFVPERWLVDTPLKYPYAFVPFGLGPRSCVGKRLAELQIKCLVAEIIRNFRVEYRYEDIGVKTHSVNIPDMPLRFTFIRRDKS